MNTLEYIESYGVETDSWIQAANTVCKTELDERMYRERITEMCNHNTDMIPVEQLTIVYGYVIQEAIRTKLSGQELFEYALDMAKQFISANKYVFAVKEADERQQQKDGTLKAKKGDKGKLALEAYKANMGKDLSRKEMMAILMDAADMSKGGASTYYANYKKQYGS